MRCKACNVILDDIEVAKKDVNGEYYDLCGDCLTVSIATHWELENMESIDYSGNLAQDDVLQLQREYDSIYLSITNEDY